MEFEETMDGYIPDTVEEIEAYLKGFGVHQSLVNWYLNEMGRRSGHHGINHVLYMIRTLKWIPAELIFNIEELVLAIIYHDVVYIPGSKTNEINSFELFEKHFSFWKEGDGERIEYVKRLIMDSVKPEFYYASTDLERDILLMHDLDYLVLGSNWPVYLEYMMGVHEEYRHYVKMDKYIEGRLKFLEKTVKTSNIFYLPWFSLKFNLVALTNMKREIDFLRGFDIQD